MIFRFFFERKKKKWQACKPGSVSLRQPTKKPISFIWPRHHCRGRCSLPLLTSGVHPETKRTTSLRCNSRAIRIYLALQPVRRTAGCVATTTGGLLPRLFTRSSAVGGDGYFLLRCYPLSKIFPLGSTVPCVARTFLPPFR